MLCCSFTGIKPQTFEMGWRQQVTLTAKPTSCVFATPTFLCWGSNQFCGVNCELWKCLKFKKTIDICHHINICHPQVAESGKSKQTRRTCCVTLGHKPTVRTEQYNSVSLGWNALNLTAKISQSERSLLFLGSANQWQEMKRRKRTFSWIFYVGIKFWGTRIFIHESRV